MPPSPVQPIYLLFQSLSHTLPLDPLNGLGGKLLYAGELDAEGRNLLYAANIAGTASLAASADPGALRHAMRDGVIDFFVNSLEEALRILKNEIRKRQAVSVGVAADPNRLVEQMLDRGVLPDLLPRDTALSREHRDVLLRQGSIQIAEATFLSGAQFALWRLDRDFARWLPRVDDCARAVLPTEDHLRHRWLKLGPRYLGRLAQRQHGVGMTEAEFATFQSEAGELLAQTGPEGTDLPRLSIEKNEF